MTNVPITFISRISHPIRRFIREIVRAAEQVTRIDHGLSVFVAPAAVVGSGGKDMGYAAFRQPLNPETQPQIWLGGDLTEMFEHGMSLDEQWEHILSCFCHELAHYEQYRDGRKVQERGVEVRARSLMKKICAATGLKIEPPHLPRG